MPFSVLFACKSLDIKVWRLYSLTINHMCLCHLHSKTNSHTEFRDPDLYGNNCVHVRSAQVSRCDHVRARTTPPDHVCVCLPFVYRYNRRQRRTQFVELEVQSMRCAYFQLSGMHLEVDLCSMGHANFGRKPKHSYCAI